MSKSGFKREHEGVRVDARYVAVALLDTGKEQRWESDWKPSHHDLGDLRQGVIAGARVGLRHIHALYGVTAEHITVTKETRRTERVTETRTRSQVDSIHTVEAPDA